MSETLLEQIQQELKLDRNASLIKLVNLLLELGQNMRASDIHLDPQENSLKVRFRIDGQLQHICQVPKFLHDELISRIKILASLRTDEHQAAQDGRFRVPISGGLNLEVRVSIVPTYFGENAVLRLLSNKVEDFNLQSLGFSMSNQEKIMNAIKKPYGMILVTGPTGSGKTTTLYTLIKMLNKSDTSIITIEDPIEYSIENINQIQVNSRTQLTFANGLRSILRQDPNIIMVGEIRDTETASIAVNTALTGHLVFSTLHTNDAATTLPRLLDMKIEPYLIASTVNVAVGQRLVRRICSHCKTSVRISESAFDSLVNIWPENLEPQLDFFTGSGCEKCDGTGYSGRIGLHEVLVMDNILRELILKKVSLNEIRKQAIEQGMKTLIEDGFNKALVGITTIEEILRMLHE